MVYFQLKIERCIVPLECVKFDGHSTSIKLIQTQTVTDNVGQAQWEDGNNECWQLPITQLILIECGRQIPQTRGSPARSRVRMRLGLCVVDYKPICGGAPRAAFVRHLFADGAENRPIRAQRAGNIRWDLSSMHLCLRVKTARPGLKRGLGRLAVDFTHLQVAPSGSNVEVYLWEALTRFPV